MIKRYYFYSANLHTNTQDPTEITGFISGIVLFSSWLPLDPITLRREVISFMCKESTYLEDKLIHLLELKRFKS